MTICSSIDTLAMAYLDDELADAELRDFELHLHGCGACRQHVDREREALAALRARLAAPPAPDLLRARVAAALDREDRAQVRARVAGWALPATASVAAVAALALFVFLPGKPSPDAVATEVVQHHLRAPQITAPMPVVHGGAPTLDLVATWPDRVRDREVTRYQFRLRTPIGGEAQIKATRIDARGLQIELGDRVIGDEATFWLFRRGDEYTLIQRAPGDVGLMFTSKELRWRDLVRVVEHHDLADRMR